MSSQKAPWTERNPSRRLLRAVKERDMARIRCVGGRWLSRLLWRDALLAEAAKRTDGAERREFGEFAVSE